MMAAAEAGLITLLLTNPIWVVKTRLCLQCDENTAYVSPENKRYKYKYIHSADKPAQNVAKRIYTNIRGIADALVKTYQYEGIRGLYRGFVPGVLGVSHSAVQFMVYGQMKTAYNKHFQLPADSQMVCIQHAVYII